MTKLQTTIIIVMYSKCIDVMCSPPKQINEMRMKTKSAFSNKTFLFLYFSHFTAMGKIGRNRIKTGRTRY